MLTIFLALVGLVAGTRLLELRVSRRHRRLLVERGARSIDDPGFAGMVLLHTSVLAGSVVETFIGERSVPLWFGLGAAVGVLGANALRVAAILSLGQHWNVSVVDSTALGVVASGPYRFIRHPNYVAVFLELLLLPLVQGAWLTATFGALLHLFVLRRRILLEEAVLLAQPAYRASMGVKPRFIPRLARRAPVLARTVKS